MPPEAAIVRRFTVAIRGANRANDMTAMTAAPVSQTRFAGSCKRKFDFATGRQHRDQEPYGEQAVAERAFRSGDSYTRLRNRDLRVNRCDNCFHEYIVRSSHYTKQTIAKYK